MNTNKDIFGLGLEISCDETSASIVKNGKEILSNIIFSQIDLHKEYSGVVPEIASRAHLEKINLLIDKSLSEAGISFSNLSYVSSTNRPGLIGSLNRKNKFFILFVPDISPVYLDNMFPDHFSVIEGLDLNCRNCNRKLRVES